MPENVPKTPQQLRKEAVRVLFETLNQNQTVSLQECYEIYDKMQQANHLASDDKPIGRD